MKIIKKTIVTILTALLLVINCGTKPVSAAEVTAEIPVDIASRVADIALYVAKGFEAFDKVGNPGSTDSLFYAIGGCNIAKGITSFLSLTMSILKLSGVFGSQPDPVMDLREHLDNRLNAINGQLDDINTKLDSLQSTLNAGLQQIDSSLGTISITQNKTNITDVAKIADSIKLDRKAFDTKLNEKLQDWYTSNNFNYDNNKLVIEYYNKADIDIHESKDEDISKVSISESVITTALAEHPTWDSNNRDTLVKNIFEKVADAIKEQDDFKEFANIAEVTINSNDNYKGKTVNQMFAEAAYDALVYECTHKVAIEKAENLVNSFSSYCDYLNERDTNYTSPLSSQYEIYKKMYAFQGELLCTYTYLENGQTRTINTNLAEMAKQRYFIELNDIGAYVAEIAKASRNYSDNNLNELIYIPWAKAEGKLNETYNSFYKTATRSSGKVEPINNYCYITDCVLTYDTGKLTSKVTTDYRTYKNWYGKRNVGYLESKIEEDWSFTISNTDMVSSIDLNKILCHFNTYKSQGATIYNYLASNNVFNGSPTPNYRPSKIITKFSGSNKFAEGDSIEMFVESCHGWDNGKYTQKTASNNDTDIISASASNFVIRQKAVADTFDIDTGAIVYSDIVGAVATYYKSNKHLDDIAMFWDTNYVERLYKNASKNDQLIHLRIVDAKTYYKESYIGSDTGRDYYKCNLDYHRPYGTIVKVPVNGFSYDNPTRTINHSATNKGVANNAISFTNDDDKNKLPTQELQTKYDSNKSNMITKFETVLKDFGYTQEQITKLELNDTYDLEFDRSSCSNVTDLTYTSLFAYFAVNLDTLVSEYKELFENAKEVVAITNNDLSVPLSDNKLNELIENIIKNDFGDSCKVCDSVPGSYVTDYIYNKTDGKLYGWDENGRNYVDYETNKTAATKSDIGLGKTIVSVSVDAIPSNEFKGNIVYYNSEFYEWKQGKYELYTYSGSEDYVEKSTKPNVYEGDIIYCTDDQNYYKWNNSGEYEKSTDTNLVYEGNINDNVSEQLTDTSDLGYSYPTSQSENIKVIYNVKPIIKFVFYLIDDDITKIAYKTVPYFDVEPQLCWTDSGAEKSIDIKNGVIKKTGISGISIKIPVLQPNNDSDNTALIYHFDDIKQTSAPIEKFNCSISEINGVKYATVSANSFSPFMVKNTFVRTDSGKKNKFPVTGIE